MKKSKPHFINNLIFQVLCVAFHPLNAALLASGSADMNINIWQITKGSHLALRTAVASEACLVQPTSWPLLPFD